MSDRKSLGKPGKKVIIPVPPLKLERRISRNGWVFTQEFKIYAEIRRELA